MKKLSLKWLKKAACVSFILAGFGLLAWFILSSQADARWRVVSTTNPIIHLETPTRWNVTSLSEDWEEHAVDRQLLVVSDGPASLSPVLVKVSAERGISFAANLSNQDPFDLMSQNVKRVFAFQYKDFQLLSEREEEIDGRRTDVLDFTTTDEQGKLFKNRIYLIIVNTDLAIYLQFFTAESDFSSYDNKYFKHMVDSLTIQ